MIKVVQAFDRMPLAEVADDEEVALERKLDTAARMFGNRDCWLKPYQRIETLQRLVTLMEGERDHFSRQIAPEGGKPLTDAIMEVAARSTACAMLPDRVETRIMRIPLSRLAR